MSRWKWELEPEEFLGDDEWHEMEEEAHIEEEKHRKRLERDFYLDLFLDDFYPERQKGNKA